MISKYRRLSSKKRRKIRTIVCRRDNYKCAYCGIDLLSSPDLFYSASVDHIKATANGGKSLDSTNMVCCCNICNNIKGDYPSKSIEDARKFIQEKRLDFEARYEIEKHKFRPSLIKKIWRLFW